MACCCGYSEAENTERVVVVATLTTMVNYKLIQGYTKLKKVTTINDIRGLIFNRYLTTLRNNMLF